MKPKFLLLSTVSFGLIGCNGDEGANSPTRVESAEEIESAEEVIKFSESRYYALPGEKISIAINSQNTGGAIAAYSQSRTDTSIVRIDVDGVEYKDINNVYAPNELGDFEIIAYDQAGAVVASSSVNTDASLVGLEVRETSDTVAMEGNISAYQAIGTFDVDGVLVSRDITNSVDWNISGSIKPLNGETSVFYFDGAGDATLNIRYGELSQEITTKVAAPLSVSSRSLTIGELSVISGQSAKLPGAGSFDLSLKLQYEDGSVADDNTIVWQLSSPQSGVTINGNRLDIQENNKSFTLNAYRTTAVDGNVQLSSSPEVSADIEVGGVDMSLSNVELQLERATYRVGDKLKYRVFKNFNSGLRSEVTDPSQVSIYGSMIDSNSLGEVSITKAGSGDVYAKVNGFDDATNSVAIVVETDSVESLLLTAYNTDTNNYLMGGQGYPFYIYNQVDNGMSEPCTTCRIVVTNAADEELGNQYYSADLTDPNYSARLQFFQPETYYVKAISENGRASSDSITITVPDNPLTSIDVSVNATVSTFLGGHITPTVTASYTDGQTRNVDSVTYSVTPAGYLDIQGDTLYPLQSGDIELTATYRGVSVSKNITLDVEENVTVQSSAIHYPQKNSIGELVLDAYHKPYMKITLSDGTVVTYSYEDVSWTIRSSDLEYEQSLQGFKFEYNEIYDGEYAYTVFVGSIYLNGELHQAENRIGVDSRISSGLWIAKLDWNKVDEIKVGESVKLYIRRGFYQPGGGIYYDFLRGTKAAPSNNNVKIVRESGYEIDLEGQSAGPVTVYFYSQYGEYLDSEEFMIIE
ncbi:hypothetical protein [Vibrio hepatarius]|uniref:hypothetical protein n=1 Tax=Vibrio hepatarius TaxID=171383 RepID=UPI003735C97F